MFHGFWCEGQIFLYPRERHIWLQLLQPFQRSARLFRPTRLSQARTQLAMRPEVLRPLLCDILAVFDSLIITPCLIMSGLRSWSWATGGDSYCGSR
jgi:hypothetical protein